MIVIVVVVVCAYIYNFFSWQENLPTKKTTEWLKVCEYKKEISKFIAQK